MLVYWRVFFLFNDGECTGNIQYNMVPKICDLDWTMIFPIKYGDVWYPPC